jgi:carboxylesterase type B
MKFSQVLSLLSLCAGAWALPAAADHPDVEPDAEAVERALKVSVTLPAGSVVGSRLLGVESFRGIPYAEPPVGNLRLRPPQKLSKALSTFDATGPAAACPQMFVSTGTKDLLGGVLGALLDLPLLESVNGQEDCLTISVQRPLGTKAGDKLPVLFWIFGGGFELGSSQMYDGTSLLSTAMLQGQPFIFVAVNYRVAGFGFMPGAEILKDGSANLGLLDQRLGLQWTADNIAAFGGDPDKVTIWGESAGSISVLDQMLLYGGDASYKGKSLFRGAIMNSGSIVPAEPVDGVKGQAIYDTVVRNSGCASSADTLACLRALPYDRFVNAANSVPGLLSYNSVALSYLPRPDGTVLPDSPQKLVASGSYHAVPMIIGDQEDEGTLFALFQPNITTTADLVGYLGDLFFSGPTVQQLTTMVNTWPARLTTGSPFRSGILNEWYPGFKRLAAILGDIVFTLTRRVFLETAVAVNPDVPAWSYLSSYNYGTPIMGTFHGSDLLQVFFGILPNNAMLSCRTYYYNFLHNLDPNVGVTRYARWPQWKESKSLMWFETAWTNSILKDDFRAESANWIKENVDLLQI